jgi:hypothetical protein
MVERRRHLPKKAHLSCNRLQVTTSCVSPHLKNWANSPCLSDLMQKHVQTIRLEAKKDGISSGLIFDPSSSQGLIL